MNKVIEVSDDPQKDGEEYFHKLNDLKDKIKKDLNEVFRKYDDRLNSL